MRPQLQVPAEILRHNEERTKSLLLADAPPEWMIDKQQIHSATVIYHDGRTLSAKQRSKIILLCQEIAEWQGEDDTILRYDFIKRFCALYGELVGYRPIFSLSDASMSEAKELIGWLIDFCLEWGVPMRRPLIQYSEDIGRYLYACLIHRKCCLCGAENSDTHHTTAVGMGVNRDEIDHVGMEAMALCRVHHTEAHTMGQPDFDERYKVFGIRIDEYAAEKLELGR